MPIRIVESYTIQLSNNPTIVFHVAEFLKGSPMLPVSIPVADDFVCLRLGE